MRFTLLVKLEEAEGFSAGDIMTVLSANTYTPIWLLRVRHNQEVWGEFSGVRKILNGKQSSDRAVTMII